MEIDETTQMPDTRLFVRAHKWLWILNGIEVFTTVVFDFLASIGIHDGAAWLVAVIVWLSILQIVWSLVGLIIAAVERSTVVYGYIGAGVFSLCLAVALMLSPLSGSFMH